MEENMQNPTTAIDWASYMSYCRGFAQLTSRAVINDSNIELTNDYLDIGGFVSTEREEGVLINLAIFYAGEPRSPIESTEGGDIEYKKKVAEYDIAIKRYRFEQGLANEIEDIMGQFKDNSFQK